MPGRSMRRNVSFSIEVESGCSSRAPAFRAVSRDRLARSSGDLPWCCRGLSPLLEQCRGRQPAALRRYGVSVDSSLAMSQPFCPGQRWA